MTEERGVGVEMRWDVYDIQQPGKQSIARRQGRWKSPAFSESVAGKKAFDRALYKSILNNLLTLLPPFSCMLSSSPSHVYPILRLNPKPPEPPPEPPP